MQISKKIFLGVLTIMSVFVFSSCTVAQKNAPGDFPSALVVVSGAKDVRFSKSNGSDQVTYNLSTDFPASGVIEEIKAMLTKQGWQPLKEDFLNPGILSSEVKGWSEYVDATKKTRMTEHLWMADWNNNKGDIVRYALRYVHPEGKDKDLNNLKVYVICIPASSVKEVQKTISEELSKKK